MTKPPRFPYNYTTVPEEKSQSEPLKLSELVKQTDNFKKLAARILEAFRAGREVNLAPSAVNRQAIEAAVAVVESDVGRRRKTGRKPVDFSRADDSRLLQNPKNVYQRNLMRARREAARAAKKQTNP